MRRFWSDRKANVAVLFAFAIVPMIGAVGAAVDYSMASAYRTDMQKALDATALALSKVVPMEQTQLEAVANQYFQANMGQHDLTNVVLTVTPVQGKLTIAVTGDYTPKIANIFGATQFTIGTSAEAVWSLGKIEIALVLDASLSMNDLGKIGALRDATVSLINVIENAAKSPGDAKIGIVPFDGMVNTGYTYATAPSWVRFDWWDANAYDSISSRCTINFSVNDVPAGTWLKAYCESRTQTSGKCQGAWGGSQWQCQNNGGKWVTTTTNGVWTSLNRNQWAGCVYNRNPALNYDASDTQPIDNATYFPAAKCFATPPQAVTPLSENWSDLKGKAKALTPTGYTNITNGLAWGWHVLSPTPVHTEGAAYNTPDLNKYIILMTDGYNTKHVQKEPETCPLNGPCADLDARTTAACTAIKAANIKIYSIRLVAGNAAVLSACATSPSMYYDVQNAGQLSSVFNSIGSEIASLHLAK